MDVALRLGAPPAAEATRSATLHDTIEVARVALVVGLVFLHYFNFPYDARPPFQGVDPNGPFLATFINGFLTFFFFSAVPLLSAISGWLFFNFTGAAAAASIRKRIGNRTRSLLLPLVVWNLATLAIAAAAQMAIPTSGFAQQFDIKVATASAWDYVNAVLALDGLPVAFQFWFVRDLFVTVLCTPVLWLMLRHAPLWGAAGLGLVWAGGYTLGIFIRTDVLFFFYLGALARRRGLDPRIGPGVTLALLLAYIAVTAARSLAPMVVDLSDPAQKEWLEFATRLVRPLGVMACWGLCLQLAATRFGTSLATFGGFAFFLHAAHYPIIALVKDVLWRVTPGPTDLWLLLHYGASVALTIGVAALAAAVIFRISPALYGLLAGGRRLV